MRGAGALRSHLRGGMGGCRPGAEPRIPPCPAGVGPQAGPWEGGGEKGCLTFSLLQPCGEE